MELAPFEYIPQANYQAHLVAALAPVTRSRCNMTTRRDSSIAFAVAMGTENFVPSHEWMRPKGLTACT